MVWYGMVWAIGRKNVPVAEFLKVLLQTTGKNRFFSEILEIHRRDVFSADISFNYILLIIVFTSVSQVLSAHFHVAIGY